jgi:hypothetical protein
MAEPSLQLVPRGAGAVMASRQADQPNDFDYFPTPPWGGRAVAELIRQLDPGAARICEPACGEGHMAFGLADTFGAANVACSDITDHGLVAPFSAGFVEVDYLNPDWAARIGAPADWMATNPPFKLAEAFVRAAWERSDAGVAVLLRSVFIESVGRHTLFTRDCPLALKANFAERIPMLAGHWDPDAPSATAYSVFLFLKPDALERSPMGPAILAAQAHGCWLETLIPPGTKARLQRRQDVATFGPLAVSHLSREADRLAPEAANAAGEKRAALLKKLTEVKAARRRIQAQVEAAGNGLLFDGGDL